MVTAILRGDDWTDASVDFIILPFGKTIEELYVDYKKWSIEYDYRCDEYFTFTQWLIKFAGAIEPTSEQLKVFTEE